MGALKKKRKHMGFLSEGDTLDWEEAKKISDYIREHGVKQFILLWNKVKERKRDTFLWGDEIEYILVKVYEKQERTTLSLRGGEILKKLQKDELAGKKDLKSLWRPEYGSFMVEGTPGVPYTQQFSSILTVEDNMRERRKIVLEDLKDDEELLSISSYPMMGVTGFLPKTYEVKEPIAESRYVPDRVINPHKRFGS